jgi:4-hydroxybenzoate polyprenyltransferase
MRLAIENRSGRPFATLFAWLSRARLAEIVVGLGAPFMGLAFALRESGIRTFTDVLLFVPAELLLVAHVQAFNDWIDAGREGKMDLAKYPWWTGNGSHRDIGKLALVFGVLSLLLFSLLPFPTLFSAAAVFVLSLFYSLKGKTMPVVSSVVHLAGGLSHFLVGYALAAPVDRSGILIGLYFGLVLAAGHLNQEVRDYQEDRINDVRTHAVRFGKGRTFAASFLLFTLSYGYLFWLAAERLVPAVLGLWVFAYPYQAFAYWRGLRHGLTAESVARLQRTYRLLFAALGIFMLLAASGSWLRLSG